MGDSLLSPFPEFRELGFVRHHPVHEGVLGPEALPFPSRVGLFADPRGFRTEGLLVVREENRGLLHIITIYGLELMIVSIPYLRG